jgi:hypothetical protein
MKFKAPIVYTLFSSLIFTTAQAIAMSEWQPTKHAPRLIGDQPLAVYTKTNPNNSGKQCIIYPEHIIITQDCSPSAGSDIYLYQQKTATPATILCEKSETAANFTLKNVWAEYFYGMNNEYLFIDSGTGTLRELYVYSIAKKEKIKTYSYDGNGFHLTKNFLINPDALIYKVKPNELKKYHCPSRTTEQRKHPMSELYAEELRGQLTIDLKNFSETTSGAHCEVRYHE